MRPEISHQVGEAHEILVTGEANASQFLFHTLSCNDWTPSLWYYWWCRVQPNSWYLGHHVNSRWA
jgi:hypothetical protein